MWERTFQRALRLALGTQISCEGENAHFAGRAGVDAVWERTFRRALRLALGTHISCEGENAHFVGRAGDDVRGRGGD